MCYITYGVGVGGLASPLGGAMNLVTINYIEKLTGYEVYYINWLIKFLPIMLILIVSNIIFMVRDIANGQKFAKSKEYFVKANNELPKMSFSEKVSLLLFCIATLSSFTRQFYQELAPGLKPAYIFMACSIVSFTITDKNGNRLIRWKNVQGKIV